MNFLICVPDDDKAYDLAGYICQRGHSAFSCHANDFLAVAAARRPDAVVAQCLWVTTIHIRALRERVSERIAIVMLSDYTKPSLVRQECTNYLYAGADQHLALCDCFPEYVYLCAVAVANGYGTMKPEPQTRHKIGDYIFDFEVERVFSGTQDHGRFFSPAQWRLFKALTDANGRTIKSPDLYEQIAGHEGDAKSPCDTIKQTIHAMRQKLRTVGLGEIIETTWSVGYSLRRPKESEQASAIGAANTKVTGAGISHTSRMLSQ